MTEIDVIFISYAAGRRLMDTTIQAIESLLASEDPEYIHFNVLVIESNKALKPYCFENATTIYPNSRFGYHKYLNIGIRRTGSPFVCLCNNDLIFHKGWASAMLAAMRSDPLMMSASPYCPRYHEREGIPKGGPPTEGYFGVLTGWCIFVKRDIFTQIGLLDENLNFWYCDADYCQTLLEAGVKNYLVPTSFVTHLGSQSFHSIDSAARLKLTRIPRLYYDYKWHHRSWARYMMELIAARVKMVVERH